MFPSRYNLFRVICKPFGLRNAPAAFQRTMAVIITSVRWQYALVYLNDIVILSKAPQEHIVHVRKVLKLLRIAEVTLRLKECRFTFKTIDYLVHVICARSLGASSPTTDPIGRLNTPNNVTKLISSLQLYSVFKQFVSNFARVATPLNPTLKKDQPATLGLLC